MLLIDRSKIDKIKRLIISILIILLIVLLIVIAISIIVVISIVIVILLISIVILIDWLLIVLLKRRKLSWFFWWNLFDVITFSNDLHFFHFLYETQNDNEKFRFFDVTLKIWIEMISCSKQLRKNDYEIDVFAMTNNVLNVNENWSLISYVFNDIFIFD